MTLMKEGDGYLWWTAQLLVKHHGEDAPLVAAQRASSLRANGDTEGWHEWQRIVVAAKALLSYENSAAA